MQLRPRGAAYAGRYLRGSTLRLGLTDTDGQGPALTRERLLGAALALYQEGGWQGASLTAIAKRVGLTTGAIYAHFKGKNELFVEVCAAQFRVMNRELHDRMEAVATPLDRVGVLKHWFSERGERAGVRLIYDLWHQATEYPRLRKALDEVYEGMTLDVERSIEAQLGPLLAVAKISARTLAVIATAMMEGLLLRQFLSQSNDSLDALFDLLTRFVAPLLPKT